MKKTKPMANGDSDICIQWKFVWWFWFAPPPHNTKTNQNSFIFNATDLTPDWRSKIALMVLLCRWPYFTIIRQIWLRPIYMDINFNQQNFPYFANVIPNFVFTIRNSGALFSLWNVVFFFSLFFWHLMKVMRVWLAALPLSWHSDVHLQW